MLTYLTELLPMLVQQAAGEVGQDTSVLVVDNDPEAGARETCTGYHPAVRYVHEPRPGIAAARSRALREAHAHDLGGGPRGRDGRVGLGHHDHPYLSTTTTSADPL